MQVVQLLTGACLLTEETCSEVLKSHEMLGFGREFGTGNFKFYSIVETPQLQL